MAKYSKNNPVSQEVKDEATRIAKSTQRPGQTKEQTKLIAQGVQKGIAQYKKQQKTKARELNKNLKKPAKVPPNPPTEPAANIKPEYRQHWLPWVLLLFSWLSMAVYFLNKSI